MDAATLLNVATTRFERHAHAISRWNEWRMQVQLADALMESERKVFTEYPYPTNRDACDVVVTLPKNCDEVTDWIELKPILDGWYYWNPSKFIGKAIRLCRTSCRIDENAV